MEGNALFFRPFFCPCSALSSYAFLVKGISVLECLVFLKQKRLKDLAVLSF